MFIYFSNKTSRIAYFTDWDATFLQSLEGTLLTKTWIATSAFPTAARADSCSHRYNAGTVVAAGEPSEADRLLAKKCATLHEVDRMVQRVRYPYTKFAYMQEYVYDRKHHDAVTFLNADRINLEPFPYLADEVAVVKKNPVLVAREIIRARQDREDILRNSERARRAFTKWIGEAQTLARLDEITRMLTVRNFKLPFEV